MSKHVPVLLQEVITNLNIKDQGIYIDCTLGGGGYFEMLIENLNRFAKGSLLIGIDQDIDSIKAYVEKTKKDYGVEIKESEIDLEYIKTKMFSYKIGKTDVVLVNTNFSNLEELVALYKKEKQVLGIVADLGFSSDQLNNGRGFSFRNLSDELDMRMDVRKSLKAKDLLNTFTQKELSKIFSEYANEPKARIVAESVIAQRLKLKFEKVGDLLKVLDTIKGIFDIEDFYQRIFQALRIAVNIELVSLKQLLSASINAIDLDGRVIMVSFHSGEDRIINEYIVSNNLVSISDKEIKPTPKEILKNPRSRSAKLRGFIK
ncbi:MAG: 16S rRNA (cytosine(1402)-N(4))-methyltransferase [bacterium]